MSSSQVLVSYSLSPSPEPEAVQPASAPQTPIHRNMAVVSHTSPTVSSFHDSDSGSDSSVGEVEDVEDVVSDDNYSAEESPRKRARVSWFGDITKWCARCVRFMGREPENVPQGFRCSHERGKNACRRCSGTTRQRCVAVSYPLWVHHCSC